jgi:hypothetical protein
MVEGVCCARMGVSKEGAMKETIEGIESRWPDTDKGRQKKVLMLLAMLIREQNETNRLLRKVIEFL